MAMDGSSSRRDARERARRTVLQHRGERGTALARTERESREARPMPVAHGRPRELDGNELRSSGTPEPPRENDREGDKKTSADQRCERERNLKQQPEREAEPDGRRPNPLREREHLLLYRETDRRHEGEDPEGHACGPSADTRESEPREADHSADRGAKRPVAHVDMAVRHLGPVMRGDRDRLNGDVRDQSTDCREGDEKEPGEALPSHVR
jgi:hypothetical protein